MSLARSPASNLGHQAEFTRALPVPALGPSPHVLNPQRDRGTLQVLDTCLLRLEDDHEKGETTVSDSLAKRFGAFVLGLTPGMSISDALELVFREQEKLLHPGLASAWIEADAAPWYPDISSRPTTERADADVRDARTTTARHHLTQTEARDLTLQIKSGMCQVSSLILKAHDGRAWSALGYGSWATYVREEFGFSRSRSYELLEHGRVLQALAAAAGVSGIPDISPYAASQIRPYLGRLIREIRVQAEGQSEVEALQLVARLVADQRCSQRHDIAHSGSRQVVGESATIAPNAGARDFDMEQLVHAVECLCKMPSAPTVVGRVPDVLAPRLAGLANAARWLTDFADLWVKTRA